MKTFAALFFVVLLCSVSAHAQVAPAQPAPTQWGTILGRVVYDGKGKFPAPRMVPLPIPPLPNQPAAIDDESLVVNKDNSGLANVVIFLRTKPSNIHPGYEHSPPQKQTLSARNLRFTPHIGAIWTKDSLELRNPENVGINVRYNSNLQEFNVLIPSGEMVTKQLKAGENLPRPLSDNIHPWMSGHFLVRDNPYFCVTDERGIFCIPNSPTNEVLEFVFWHERCGYMKGMPNQAPNPAHNTALNQLGRVKVWLTEPVLDLGEFLADPKKLKE